MKGGWEMGPGKGVLQSNSQKEPGRRTIENRKIHAQGTGCSLFYERKLISNESGKCFDTIK